MQLKQLLKDIEIVEMAGSPDIDIPDIAYHTGDVKAGSCFVAIPGHAADGHDYIEKAVEEGAKVIVSSRPVKVPAGIVGVVVEDPRVALALMSARLFGDPSKNLKLVGVTGTNGKTTITYLLEAIWRRCGFATGVVGTVNYRYDKVLANPRHTTPESYDLQKLFADMAEAGVDHVAMEVSSHSLDQGRVCGCHFDGGIFTNLTQDHLDYHLDMERYKSAKALMFSRHLADSEKMDVWAAINIDDSFGNQLAGRLPYKIYAYSLDKRVDVFIEEDSYSFAGARLKVRVGNDLLEIDSRLIGRHNASNILGAVAAAHAMNLPMAKVVAGVESVEYVPGRLEPVPNRKGLKILVDYAHTPDALRNVTTALKALKPKRLITVFGCGGDRDKAKRPMMGFETALRSDILIVTSDNPRGEDPQKIIDEILTGVKKVGLGEYRVSSGYLVEADRRAAIARAIEIAEPGDVVLIAGKGHENYQIVGAERLHFDDVEVVKEMLS